METAPKPVNIIIADAHFRLIDGIRGCLSNPAYNILCVRGVDELFNLAGNAYHILLFNYNLPGFTAEDNKWNKRFPGIKYVAYSYKPNWSVAEHVKDITDIILYALGKVKNKMAPFLNFREGVFMAGNYFDFCFRFYWNSSKH